VRRLLGPRASLALAVVLLIGAGLLRHQLAQMDPMFSPRSWPGLKGLGYYLVAAYAPAARAYREQARLDPSSSAHESAGVLALEQGRPTEALETFERILGRVPNHADALMLSAVAHAQLGDHGRAIDRINRMLRQKSFASDLTSLHVLELAGVLAARPVDARPYCLLAQLYRYLRVLDPSNGRLAVKAAREAIRRGDRVADAYLAIGVVAEKEERMADALAAYERVTATDPTHAEGYRRQAVLHAWRGDLVNQYRAIRAAFELVPGDQIYVYELETAVLDRLGDASAAVPLMRRALDADPTSRVAHRGLGWAHGLLGEYDQSVAHYGEAIRLAPAEAEGWQGLAWVLQYRGDTDGAIAAFQEALGRDPRDWSAYAGLGALYGRLRRSREAAQAYTRALQLGDQRLGTYFALCVQTYESGEFARASGCFRQVLQRDPDNASARRYVVWSDRNAAQQRASP
jgi:tetratricopeptide (TPR) repeat protein